MVVQTNPERSLKTQTSILQATILLVKQKGWQNTKIQEVCAQAGVSVGAFYHHFSSKQELIYRAFLLFDETLDDTLNFQINDSKPPIEAIKEVLITQTAFIVKEAGPLISEYYRNILSDEKRSAVDPQRKYYGLVLKYVSEAKSMLKKPYTPVYVTELLIKYVRGSIIDWCLHDYGYDVVERTTLEIDLLIEALFGEIS